MMNNIKEKAIEIFKNKPSGYESNLEINIYCDGFQEGYNQGQKELICLMSDFLGISLTYKDPVEVAKKLFEKIKEK